MRADPTLYIGGAVAIAVAALLLTAAPASALTYLEWEKAPVTWKRGYVHGLMDHAATQYWNAEHRDQIEPRLECYARVGSSTEQLVRMVSQYAAAKPELHQRAAAVVVAEYLASSCP